MFALVDGAVNRLYTYKNHMCTYDLQAVKVGRWMDNRRRRRLPAGDTLERFASRREKSLEELDWNPDDELARSRPNACHGGGFMWGIRRLRC